MLDSRDSALAAKRMLKQGYVFGKSNLNGRPDHHAMAEVLRKQILKNPGKTDSALRQAIAKRATGGSPLEAPYDELALQIGKGGYGVSDSQVKEVVAKSGSEKTAFELIAAAAVGAGLYRWDKGIIVLKEIFNIPDMCGQCKSKQ